MSATYPILGLLSGLSPSGIPTNNLHTALLSLPQNRVLLGP
jgi:hypothetical protein